jgi:hypothetical protein
VRATGVQVSGFSDVADVMSLAGPLLSASPRRATGDHPSQPVLVCAAAGTGKSWSSVQLIHTMARQCEQRAQLQGVPLVPVLVYVQARLQRSEAAARERLKTLSCALRGSG